MTRREAIGRLAARLVPLYDPREARSIALAAAAGISGLTTTALLTDPGAELRMRNKPFFPLSYTTPDTAKEPVERRG